MEVGLGLAPFKVYKARLSGFWGCTFCKFNQSGPKELVLRNF